MPELLASYDAWLVTISVIVAVLASYAALDLSARISAAPRGWGRAGWVVGGAIAMGCGIWSMHFVAMLALRLSVPIRYDVTLTVLSLVVAIVAAGLALLLANRPSMSAAVVAAGGICMGIAIAGMHYTGMAAMVSPVMVHFHAGLWWLSIAIAVAASCAALVLAFRFKHDTGLWVAPRGAAAVIMGAAIAGMHYTGMAAAHFTRGPDVDVAGVLATRDLAVAVVFGTLLILGLTFLSAAVTVRQQRVHAKQRRLTEAAARRSACFCRPSILPRTTRLRMPDTIGFIGLGLMGRPMAKNLLKAGFPLVVHSRSQGPVDDLVAAGATRAGSPADVARRATRIITMLPDSPDVERVLDGPDGVFSALQKGAIVIDMSSIEPATAVRMAERAAGLGGTMLDAPVSGGEIGAIDGTLSIMVGGDANTVAACKPIFEAMGKADRIIHIGEAGAGQVCKLCNQIVLGGTIAAVGEAFSLARKAKVDPAKVREALLGGFAQSRVLEVHGERMIKANYKPGFRTELFAKDLRNVASAQSANGAPAPVTAVVQQLVNSLVAQGRGKNDYAELGKVLFELAGLE